MKQLRDPRTLLGIGLVWGIVWAVLAMIAGTVIAVIDPAQIDPGEEPIVLAPIIGLVGFICGLPFGAALVSTAARGQRISDLPLMRVASWGILVAAVLPLVTGKGIPEVLVTVPVGAASAMVSVAIMRRRTT
jgi:hypothetical protein